MTPKMPPTSKKSAQPRRRSAASLERTRIKQRIANVEFTIMLYTRDNNNYPAEERICKLNDELDYLLLELEKWGA